MEIFKELVDRYQRAKGNVVYQCCLCMKYTSKLIPLMAVDVFGVKRKGGICKRCLDAHKEIKID